MFLVTWGMCCTKGYGLNAKFRIEHSIYSMTFWHGYGLMNWQVIEKCVIENLGKAWRLGWDRHRYLMDLDKYIKYWWVLHKVKQYLQEQWALWWASRFTLKTKTQKKQTKYSVSDFWLQGSPLNIICNSPIRS